MKTCKLNCEITWDLIPLVRDGAASSESEQAVLDHIQNCQACQKLYRQEIPDQAGAGEKRLRRRIRLTGMILPLLMSLAGIGLLGSSYVFYDFILLPLTGLCAAWLLGKASFWLVPLWLFILYTIWSLLQIMMGQPNLLPAAYIYPALCTLFSWAGSAIYLLLAYGFGKE